MMGRDAIYELGEETLRRVISDPPKDAYRYLCRVTSGTSGTVPLVLVTEYPAEAPKDAVGGRADERMLSFNGSVSSRLANVFIVSRAQGTSAARVLSLGVEDIAPGLESLLADYQPNLLHGFPSFISRALQYVSDSVGTLVERVTLSGEPLTESFEKVLREKFLRAALVELYMALEVGGYIGTRFCGHLARGQFHPARGVVVEIFEPDEEGVGDIAVSKQIFSDIQVKQYCIGDVGRIIPGACTCGEQTTFELRGRSGIDYIKVGGGLLTRSEFDRAVAQFPELIDDYRVDVDSSTVPARIRLSLFRRAGAGSPALAQEVADKISRSLFVTQTKTLYDLAAEGFLAPLVGTFSEAPFTSGHKDVKLRLRRISGGRSDKV